MKYSMHYSYKGIGDVLIIIFNNSLTATRYEKKDRITVIYHDDEIIGYNIFDIKDIIKIKNEGMIYLPNPALIEVVNTMLHNAGVPTLEPFDNSGYFIGEVMDAIPLDEHKTFVTVSLNDEYISTIAKDATLEIGDKVVVAKVGTRLSNGETVKEGNMDGTLLNGHICTNHELGIKEKETEITILEKEAVVGQDFFSLEAK